MSDYFSNSVKDLILQFESSVITSKDPAVRTTKFLPRSYKSLDVILPSNAKELVAFLEEVRRKPEACSATSMYSNSTTISTQRSDPTEEKTVKSKVSQFEKNVNIQPSKMEHQNVEIDWKIKYEELRKSESSHFVKANALNIQENDVMKDTQTDLLSNNSHSQLNHATPKKVEQLKNMFENLALSQISRFQQMPNRQIQSKLKVSENSGHPDIKPNPLTASPDHGQERKLPDLNTQILQTQDFDQQESLVAEDFTCEGVSYSLFTEIPSVHSSVREKLGYFSSLIKLENQKIERDVTDKPFSRKNTVKYIKFGGDGEPSNYSYPKFIEPERKVSEPLVTANNCLNICNSLNIESKTDSGCDKEHSICYAKDRIPSNSFISSYVPVYKQKLAGDVKTASEDSVTDCNLNKTVCEPFKSYYKTFLKQTPPMHGENLKESGAGNSTVKNGLNELMKCETTNKNLLSDCSNLVDNFLLVTSTEEDAVKNKIEIRNVSEESENNIELCRIQENLSNDRENNNNILAKPIRQASPSSNHVVIDIDQDSFEANNNVENFKSMLGVKHETIEQNANKEIRENQDTSVSPNHDEPLGENLTDSFKSLVNFFSFSTTNNADNSGKRSTEPKIRTIESFLYKESEEITELSKSNCASTNNSWDELLQSNSIKEIPSPPTDNESINQTNNPNISSTIHDYSENELPQMSDENIWFLNIETQSAASNSPSPDGRMDEDDMLKSLSPFSDSSGTDEESEDTDEEEEFITDIQPPKYQRPSLRAKKSLCMIAEDGWEESNQTRGDQSSNPIDYSLVLSYYSKYDDQYRKKFPINVSNSNRSSKHFRQQVKGNIVPSYGRFYMRSSCKPTVI